MAVKLQDVATEAGVSLATASRAFGAPELVSQATRRRVVDAALRIGYEPPAPRLAKTFAVIVPDVSNSVYAAMLHAMQQEAWPGRHRMVLADSSEDPAREVELLRTVGQDVDGVVLCSPRSQPEDAAAAVRGTPLVVVNGVSAGAPVVLMDVELGITQTVEYLSSLGHTLVAYVPGPAASWADRMRGDLLADHAGRRGLDLVVVGHQSADIRGGRAAAAAVGASGATAVVAYNDLVAIGVQAGLADLGRRCPEDISVIGIDDIDIAAASNPGLTSVQVDTVKAGSMSLHILLDAIDGKPVPPNAVRLGSQLVVRGSTAPPPPGSLRSIRK